MQRNERALKKLGIQAVDLFSSSLASSPQGTLKPDEHSLFWSQVEHPREATSFVCDVLQRLVASQTHPHPHPNAVTVGVAVAVSVDASSQHVGARRESDADSAAPLSLNEALLTTLAFSSLLLDYNVADVRIKRLMDMWKHDQKELRGVKEVLRVLVLRSELNVTSISTDVVGPFVIGCSTLHHALEFQKRAQALSDAPYQNGVQTFVQPSGVERERDREKDKEKEDLGPLESTFYYTHLLQLCTTSAYKLVLQSTVSKLLTLPQQMRLNPIVAETTLFALLHMMRGFLCVQPCVNEDDLNSFVSIVSHYQHWPQPFGSLAVDLLHTLHAELQWPGDAMRQRIMSDALKIAYRSSINSSSATEIAKQWAPALFYFHDADDTMSATLVRTLELTRWRTPSWLYDTEDTPIMTAELMSNLILSLLRCESGTSEAKVVECIRSLTTESLVAAFNYAMECTRNVIDQLEGVKEARRIASQSIRDFIQQISNSQEKGTCALGESILMEPYVPSPLSCHHLSLPSRITYEMINREQLRLLNMNRAPYPTTPAFALLCSVLNTYKRPSTSSDIEELSKLCICIVIAGSDEMLHSFLCAYLLLQQQKSELLSQLSCQFYLVPLQRNRLASFLSRHDAWYLRHVFAPFRAQPFILPSLRIEEHSRDEHHQSSVCNAPGKFLRACIEQYIRNADVSSELIVWQLEAWLNDDSVNTPDHIVPFLQRVEVVTSHPRQGVEATPPELILSHRKIALAFRDMDNEQNIQVSDLFVDESTVYSHLLFSVIPWARDPPFLLQVGLPSLQYNVKVHRNYQRATLKSTSMANDGHGSVHVVEMRCVQPKDSFALNVDGQVFGPYYRVHLSPIPLAKVDQQDTSSKWTTFPIRHFYPTSTS